MKNMKARVLVVSPYHNRAHVVERTIRSIAEQTFSDFCCYIWDDASTDTTWQEITRVSQLINDNRFYFHRYDNNVGLTRGLNNSLSFADVDYLAIVGSGDVCDPQRLEKQVYALDSDMRASYCCSKSVTIDERTGDKFFDDHFDRHHVYHDDLLDTVPFTHGTVMYRMTALKSIGGYEEVFKWCADWDVFLRISTLGYGLYINEVLYNRFALLDGVSFNPEKSIEQIKYKYLVKVLSKCDNHSRQVIIQKAKLSLENAIKSEEVNIVKDTFKRLVKLHLMGRNKQALMLESLINDNYGKSKKICFLSRTVYLFSLLPLSPNFKISVFRNMSRIFK